MYLNVQVRDGARETRLLQEGGEVGGEGAAGQRGEDWGPGRNGMGECTLRVSFPDLIPILAKLQSLIGAWNLKVEVCDNGCSFTRRAWRSGNETREGVEIWE